MSGFTKKQKRPRKLDHYLPKRNNQFLKIWLKKYPWLVYDEILNLMFCGLCRKHGVTSKGNQVSFFYGTDNFRTEFLNAHHLSEPHAKASLMEATSGSPGSRTTKELMVRTMSREARGGRCVSVSVATFPSTGPCPRSSSPPPQPACAGPCRLSKKK